MLFNKTDAGAHVYFSKSWAQMAEEFVYSWYSGSPCLEPEKLPHDSVFISPFTDHETFVVEQTTTWNLIDEGEV